MAGAEPVRAAAGLATGSAVIEVVVMSLLAFAVLTVVIGTVAGVAAYRRLRRSAGLATAALRVHLVTDSGPQREVVQLRLRLRHAVEGGREAVCGADARVGLPGEAAALFRRLQREARTVDLHLRLLQTEDDRATLDAALPAMRGRVDEITGLVRGLRTAVAAGLGAGSDAALVPVDAGPHPEELGLVLGGSRIPESNDRAIDTVWTEGGARSRGPRGGADAFATGREA